jgi:hypothetical protein
MSFATTTRNGAELQSGVQSGVEANSLTICHGRLVHHELNLQRTLHVRRLQRVGGP